LGGADEILSTSYKKPIFEESNQFIKKFIKKQIGWPISDTRDYEILGCSP
jgi:hypothetical protein